MSNSTCFIVNTSNTREKYKEAEIAPHPSSAVEPLLTFWSISFLYFLIPRNGLRVWAHLLLPLGQVLRRPSHLHSCRLSAFYISFISHFIELHSRIPSTPYLCLFDHVKQTALRWATAANLLLLICATTSADKFLGSEHWDKRHLPVAFWHTLPTCLPEEAESIRAAVLRARGRPFSNELSGFVDFLNLLLSGVWNTNPCLHVHAFGW